MHFTAPPLIHPAAGSFHPHSIHGTSRVALRSFTADSLGLLRRLTIQYIRHTLSCLTVSSCPESRLRHRRSSSYLCISPLHHSFHLPLPYSSPPVFPALPHFSTRISHQPYPPAYPSLPPNTSAYCSPPVRASRAVSVQKVAFATGVPPKIYAFHRYTRNSTFLGSTQGKQF